MILAANNVCQRLVAVENLFDEVHRSHAFLASLEQAMTFVPRYCAPESLPEIHTSSKTEGLLGPTRVELAPRLPVGFAGVPMYLAPKPG